MNVAGPNRVECAGALLIAPLLCLAACSADIAGGSAGRREKTTSGAAKPAAKIVEVVHPSPSASHAYPSSLYVERDVRVTARRSGVIEKVLADRGDRVAAGALLAVLETDLAAREVDLADQEVRLTQAELDRLGPLRDQQVVSPQEHLRAQVARDQAVTKAALARAWLDRCDIRAPFDGVVADRWAVRGMRIREEDAAPLFRVVARDPLRARVDYPEDRLASVSAGGTATIAIPGGESRAARIVFVSPAADAASGSVPVIVETGAADARLRPGMSVLVRFDSSAADEKGTFLVPREAFPAGAMEGRDADVLIAANGRALTRRLHLVAINGGAFEVRGELSAADTIIVAGAGISNGDPVQTRERER